MKDNKQAVSRPIVLFFSTELINGEYVSTHEFEENTNRLLDMLKGKHDLVLPIIPHIKRMVNAHLTICNTFKQDSPSQVIKNMNLVYMNQVGEYIVSVRRYIELVSMISLDEVEENMIRLKELAETFNQRAESISNSIQTVIEELTNGATLIK